METCMGQLKYKSTQVNSKKPHKKPNKASIEAVQVTIQKKKQCNAKALDIVTRFSEGTISEMCLIENLQFINQEHYQDIVEERAINKLCGYPLCSTQLKNIPSKKYHISTSHNKVFDITDRKNFCSNLCYKASKFLKDQIPTSPLWLRDNFTSDNNYKLISRHDKGGTVGDEVDLGFTPIKVGDDDLLSHKVTSNSSKTIETDQLINPETIEGSIGNETVIVTSLSNSISSFKANDRGNSATLKSSQIKGSEQSCTEDKTELSHNMPNLSESGDKMFFNEQLLENQDVIESQIKSENIDKETDVLVDIVKLKPVMSELHNKTQESKEVIKKERKVKSKNKKSCLKHDSKQSPPMQVIITKIEHVLREWFSLDSLCFIFGEEKLKEMLEEKNSHCVSELNTVVSRKIDPHMYEKYLAICKRLNVLELEDIKMDIAYKEDTKRPLPDYEVLKEEAKELDLKVKMFYKGDKLVHFEEPHEGALSSNYNKSNQEPVLPLVDLHAQKALRRRIVIDKFKRVLQDLQISLRLKGFNLFEPIQALVSTFDLSAHNITMRPAEWNLITIVTIKLLSVRDKTLEQVLTSNPTNKYLTLLLMSYSIDNGYLDRLIVWLTDIETVLQKKS